MEEGEKEGAYNQDYTVFPESVKPRAQVALKLQKYLSLEQYIECVNFFEIRYRDPRNQWSSFAVR